MLIGPFVSLEEMSTQVLRSFFNSIVFLLLNCRSSLRGLDINALYIICKYFITVFKWDSISALVTHMEKKKEVSQITVRSPGWISAFPIPNLQKGERQQGRGPRRWPFDLLRSRGARLT